MKTTTKRFSILGEDSAFICDGCKDRYFMTRFGIALIFSMLSALLLVALLAFASTPRLAEVAGPVIFLCSFIFILAPGLWFAQFETQRVKYYIASFFGMMSVGYSMTWKSYTKQITASENQFWWILSLAVAVFTLWANVRYFQQGLSVRQFMMETLAWKLCRGRIRRNNNERGFVGRFIHGSTIYGWNSYEYSKLK